MEEAVTRKFVHEESGSITSLCGTVFTLLFKNKNKMMVGLLSYSF